jgi:phosphate-selective porin
MGNSLVPGRDNCNSGRDIGVQLEGTYSVAGNAPLLDYSVGLFNGAGINRRDDNRRKDVAVRLVVHPTRQLLLAGDYYDGAAGVDRASRERVGVELAYIEQRYSLRAEYVWGRDAAVHRRGGYGLAAYRFLPQWEGLLRFDRYEPGANARSDTYLLGVNWYFSRWAKWQANYGVVDENTRMDATHTGLSQIQFQF